MRNDCILCSFLPVVGEKERKRTRREAQEEWPEWDSHLETDTSSITCIAERLLLELCEFLPVPKGCDSWSSLSSLFRWAVWVASEWCHTSIPTDLCTWIDMVPLDLVIQAWWVTHYCNIYKRPFITQHLMNFTLSHSWGNECVSSRGILSYIYICTGDDTISYRSINSTTLNQESESSLIYL